MTEYREVNDYLKAIVRIPGWPEPGGMKFGRKTGALNRARGYTASVWAYRCSTVLGNSIGAMPWGLFAGEDRMEENHPAMSQMGDVNEKANLNDTLRNTMIDMKLHGFGVWAPQVVGGKLIRYKRLPAIECRIKDDGEEVMEITWTRGNKRSVLNREEVVYFSSYGAMRNLDPDSPMRVVIAKARAEQNMDQTVVDHFANSAIPPYIMTSDQNVQDRDLKRYDDWWNAKFRDLKQRFKVLWVGGGLKAFRMRGPMGEMALKELREAVRMEICAGFGVLPSVAGAGANANRATWKQELIATHHLTIIPDGIYMAGVINAEMKRTLFDEPEFKFLPEELEILQEEKGLRSKRVREEVKMGILTPQAAARELGYEPEDVPAGFTAVKEMAVKAEMDKVIKKAENWYRLKAGRPFEFRSEIIEEDALKAALWVVDNSNNIEEVKMILERLR